MLGQSWTPERATPGTQQHEACGYCYIVVRCDEHLEAPVVYRGRGAAEHLLNALQAEERKIRAALASPEAMVTMT